MLSNYSKPKITHLGPVEESLPSGMAILSTPLRQDGFFIYREISMEKLCECGCGNPTLPAKWTDKRTGSIRGIPTRFIYQHSFRGKREQCPNWKGGRTRTGSDEYDLIRSPMHPRASNGYVLEHILIAEEALGKTILPPVEVHHHTDIQLVICENTAYHRLLHQRTRAFENSGHVNWVKCWMCKKYDDPKNLSKVKGRNAFYHVLCENKRHRDRYSKKHDGNVRSWKAQGK